MNKIFTSRQSMQDALNQCQRAGCTPAGQTINQRGEFVVFGRYQPPQPNPYTQQYGFNNKFR